MLPVTKHTQSEVIFEEVTYQGTVMTVFNLLDGTLYSTFDRCLTDNLYYQTTLKGCMVHSTDKETTQTLIIVTWCRYPDELMHSASTGLNLNI